MLLRSEDYIDKQLIATAGVKEAIIVSAEDGALWASHPEDFVPRAYPATIALEDGTEQEEMVNEAENLAYVGKHLKKPKTGLRINHQKFLIVRAMETGIEGDGLKTIYFKRPGGGGCLCVTNKAIIIGTFEDASNQTSQHCVSRLALVKPPSGTLTPSSEHSCRTPFPLLEGARLLKN